MGRTSLRRLVAAVVVAACSLAASSASADGPDQLLDPNTEGSLVDVTNAVGAAFDNLAARNADASAVCVSSATDPEIRPNSSSPTLHEVYSIVAVGSLTDGTCSDTWRMQRRRWSGYSTLRSITGSAIGTASVYEATLSVYCLAGTWHYRVKANGYSTKSVPFTCARPSNPFYIDYS